MSFTRVAKNLPGFILRTLKPSSSATTEEKIATQWKALRILFSLASVIWLLSGRSEEGYAMWGATVAVCLLFLLVVKGTVFTGVIRLILSLVTVPISLAFGMVGILTGVSLQACRLFLWDVWRPEFWTSLAGLSYGIFVTWFASFCLFTFEKSSPPYQLGLYLGLPIGIITLVGLLRSCLNPLEIWNAVVLKSSLFIKGHLKDETDPGKQFFSFLTGSQFYSWLISIDEKLKDPDFEEGILTTRLYTFIGLWFALLLTGTVLFTNIFIVISPSTGVLGWKAYLFMLLDNVTALLGIVHGDQAHSLLAKAVLGLFVLFAIFCLAVLILIHSVQSGKDLRRLKRTVASEADNLAKEIVDVFQQKFMIQDREYSVSTLVVKAEHYQAWIAGKEEWKARADLTTQETEELKKLTSFPIRIPVVVEHNRVPSSMQIEFLHYVACAPTVENLEARQVNLKTFEAPVNSRGFIHVKCDLPTQLLDAEELATITILYTAQMLSEKQQNWRDVSAI
jgi:hypothetical protein